MTLCLKRLSWKSPHGNAPSVSEIKENTGNDNREEGYAEFQSAAGRSTKNSSSARGCRQGEIGNTSQQDDAAIDQSIHRDGKQEKKLQRCAETINQLSNVGDRASG